MTAGIPDTIGRETLDLLHPDAETNRAAIRSLVEHWCDASIEFWRGTNRSIDRETAKIASIDGEEIVFACTNFGPIDTFLFLSTEFHGFRYFSTFQVCERPKESGSPKSVATSFPAVIYRAERRDRHRRPATRRNRSVRLIRDSLSACPATVLDESGDGLGLLVPETERLSVGEHFRLEETTPKRVRWAVVRNNRGSTPLVGWRRVGLSVVAEAPGHPIPSEPIAEVLEELGGISSVGEPADFPESPSVVSFVDHKGEKIVGLLDQTRDVIPGAPAVLIPAAWGKTKETLVGLAATLVSTFASQALPVSVIRFDGIRKRGESHNDPECAGADLENLHYTFAQGATDLLAAAKFAQEELGAGAVLIVSFSVASIEARRAIVIDSGERFCGWVSVVGATDPQSLIRVISGGVDYLGGAERGASFGRQSVQGLLLDIDRTATEALSSKIAFLEDARRDFSEIDAPVTWITGRHDAWMDPRRIQDVLRFGRVANRRLIETETGHQLKSSVEAFEIFGVAASECVRMISPKKRVRPVVPSGHALRKRQKAEARRVRRPEAQLAELQSFWRDYLVGRDDGLGMEMVTETRSFRDLMASQVSALDLQAGDLVLDLGSGVSTFERALVRSDQGFEGIRVVAIDYVREAMARGRVALGSTGTLAVAHVVADLSVAETEKAIPIRKGSVQKVLASLLLNYLAHPDVFVRQVFDVLRPNGRLVLSVLRDDADTSKICVDGVVELRSGQGLAAFGAAGERRLGESLSTFINDAARLLDFEERGVFRFWEYKDLEGLLVAAGFTHISAIPAFGVPPQAWLVTAVKQS